MNLEEFVAGFAEQFDDTDPEEIQANTVFHELDEWSSLTGMSIMAYIKASFGKAITPGELRNGKTVEDVFNLMQGK